MNPETAHRLDSLQIAIDFFLGNELIMEKDFQTALDQIIICHYMLIVLE